MTRIVLFAFALIVWLLPLCGEPPNYTVRHLAGGAYLFSANFYSSLFVVTSEGVIVTDPVSPATAHLYQEAIHRISQKPVRYVIYSHDHTDHIAGGVVFRDTAEFIAHENARAHILERGNPDIVVPQRTFRDHYNLHLGDEQIRLLYLGHNHTDSNIAILLPKERVLMFVDMIYPGSVPFRDMPGTSLPGFVKTLERVKKLDFDLLLYGHGPPGKREWVDKYIAYFSDMRESLERNERLIPFAEVMAKPSADPRQTLDLYVERITGKTVEDLRPKYGSWGGFDEWAPMNVQRVFFYLMMET